MVETAWGGGGGYKFEDSKNSEVLELWVPSEDIACNFLEFLLVSSFSMAPFCEGHLTGA